MGFPAKSSHFFRLILSDNVHGTGLKFPKKFIMEHGKSMSNRVLLQVPDGRLWQVELMNNNNGEVWLKEGLEEFTKHYSIGFGHFLVFRYQGNSVFNIIIFDTSASEIEYPTKDVCGDSRKGCNDISAQNQDDNSTRKKSPVTYLQHGKKAKLDSIASISEGDINGELTDTRTNVMKPVKLEEDANPCPQDLRNKKVDLDISSVRKTPANGIAKGRDALRLANAFKTNIKSPYFFTITMQRSYVSGRYSLNIPSSFNLGFFNAKNNDIVLRVSDGRTWAMKRLVYARCCKLDLGWKTFVLDNSLAVGDVCVFELISKMQNLLKVFVFRAS